MEENNNQEKESNMEKILFSTDFVVDNEEEAFLLGYNLGRK